MIEQQKQWVFTELVKDPNNIEQLISYTIYKGFKNEIADNARKMGKTEDEINEELAKYHNYCISSQKQLDVFRDKAKNTLDAYIFTANHNMTKRFNAEIIKIKNHYDKELELAQKKLKIAEKKALNKLSKGAVLYSQKIKEPEHLWDKILDLLWRLMKFLFSGVPKLFATAFSGGLMFTIYTAFDEDATTGLRKGLYKIVDMTVPGKDIHETTDNITNSGTEKTSSSNSQAQQG